MLEITEYIEKVRNNFTRLFLPKDKPTLFQTFNQETREKLVKEGYTIITLKGFSSDLLLNSSSTGIVYLTPEDIPKGKSLNGEFAIPNTFLTAPDDPKSLGAGSQNIKKFEEDAKNKLVKEQIIGVESFTPDILTLAELIYTKQIKPEEFSEIDLPSNTIVPINIGMESSLKRLKFSISPERRNKHPKQGVVKPDAEFNKYIYLVRPL